MKHWIIIFTCLVSMMTTAYALEEEKIQGNWEGQFASVNNDVGELSAKVIADGNGLFHALVQIFTDNNPGPTVELPGKIEGEKVVLSGMVDVGPDMGGQYQVTAEIANDVFQGQFNGSPTCGRFTLHKVYKSSPTLDQQAPADAILLFDGKNFNAWQKSDGTPVSWKLVADNAMEVAAKGGNIITRQEFADHKLHIEFRTPFMPAQRGQSRGNSGVYVQGRYEVQVLDSYGLQALDNECGGIYKIAAPRVNACLPPTEWQTYDITFYAPRFDQGGTKTQNARITVQHNGITIHENLELPNPTGGAFKTPEVSTGPLMLQDHGNPVQFRNIWVVKL
jgi:hypothetical protein